MATLQINQYGAEVLALTPRPVIYAEDADHLGQSRPTCRSFDSADQRVRAERHPEPAQQTLAGTPSQGATHHSDNLIGSLGLSCVRGANLEGTFGKDSPLATGIAATPATDVHSEDHRSALDRKVLQRTPIAAMARARNGLATRTNSRVLTVSLHDPTLVCLEHAAKRQLAKVREEVWVR